MPDAKCSYRFLVDETSFFLDELTSHDIEIALEGLADQLHLARIQGELVGIISGWELVEYRPGVAIHKLLVGSNGIDRDVRLRIAGLLDKCGRFDSDIDFFVDPVVDVNNSPIESFALATVLAAQRSSIAVGVFSMSATYGRGLVDVRDSVGGGKAVIVKDEQSRCEFYRWSYEVEDISEEVFFQLARLAFPRVRFAEGVNFRKFDGTYLGLRAHVVEHLGRINDRFCEAYKEHNGRSDDVAAALQIDISMESTKTRGSAQLMRQRDAVFNGKVYRCEWHSKIERHRNRIHLHPGDKSSDNCVVIGAFVDHFPT